MVAGPAVAGGVVEEVAEGLVQAVGVGVHHNAVEQFGVDPEAGRAESVIVCPDR